MLVLFIAVIVTTISYWTLRNWNCFEEWMDYMTNYYINTLTRAGPFLVGMIFGYLLFTWKGLKPKIPLLSVLLLWACTFTVFALIFYSKYVISRFDWDNQTADIFINSFSRSGWGAGIGWLIFACVHGYAGPINWFLSLDVWKLPSRLSYAMYLLHFPFQFAINATQIAPIYFTVGGFFFKYMAHLMFVLIISFIATLLIDGPCSVLIKLMIGNGVKKQRPPVNDLKAESTNTNNDDVANGDRNKVNDNS